MCQKIFFVIGGRFPYGLVVRIPAFHAGGPGSIPGVGGRGFVDKITWNPFPIAGNSESRHFS